MVSLYSLDANSTAASEVMGSSAGDRFLTTLGELEVSNALALRVFRKQVSAAQALASLDAFENDLREGLYRLRTLPNEAFKRAREISRHTTAKLGARTVDLLHVAAALVMEVDCLYSFDEQQRKLAHALHLGVN
jgi:hypothetical protein